MVRATQVDVGFDASRLLVLTPALGRGLSEAEASAYWRIALERVEQLPGVHMVRSHRIRRMEAPARSRSSGVPAADTRSNHHQTKPAYFATLGLRAIRGRTYTAEDVASGASVAVISETIARDFFPGEDPIGQPLERVIEGSRGVIIGVVSNAITARLRELSSAALYRPMRDHRGAHLVIRALSSPESLIPAVRTALQPIDPRIRLEVRSVSDRLREQIDEPRTLALLAGVLAGLALALAVVGIYGVTSFVVGQRTSEIGLRIALGASARDVMRLLLSESLRPVAVGLGVGVFAAMLGSRIFAGALFGISPLDPMAFTAAIGVLLCAATAAVILPTRRAASVDPAVVLRQL